jgi:hypothetical protein
MQQPSTNVLFDDQQLNFQNFDYSNTAQYNNPSFSYNQPMSQNVYAPPVVGPVTWATVREAFTTGSNPEEPPLLQELGINFDHIKKKSVTVLNPFKAVDKHIMDDTDLAGPFVFCLLFGGFLLLSGKIHFGYIYGVGVLGCLSMYTILNLMSENGIDIYQTTSVLGYCLLPMVLLSSLAMLLNLSGFLGLIISTLSVLWCTNSASVMFVTVLSMSDQRFLVAYPVGLLYSAFAILAVF